MIRQSPHFMPGSTGHLLFSIYRCARACPFPGSSFFRLSKIEFPWGCSASRFPCGLHGEDLAMARALNFGCRPRAQTLEPTSQHPLKQNSWPRLYHLQIGSSSRSNFIPLYVHPPLAYRPTPVSIGSPRKKGIIPDSPFSCNRVSLAENLLHPGGTLEHPN